MQICKLRALIPGLYGVIAQSFISDIRNLEDVIIFLPEDQVSDMIVAVCERMWKAYLSY
jgi:hypothetical protein